jgi:hypothetical protein
MKVVGLAQGYGGSCEGAREVTGVASTAASRTACERRRFLVSMRTTDDRSVIGVMGPRGIAAGVAQHLGITENIRRLKQYRHQVVREE